MKEITIDSEKTTDNQIRITGFKTARAFLYFNPEIIFDFFERLPSIAIYEVKYVAREFFSKQIREIFEKLQNEYVSLLLYIHVIDFTAEITDNVLDVVYDEINKYNVICSLGFLLYTEDQIGISLEQLD